ncbi:hypothetical protein NQZ68_000757 [Dissostichus eleginoides]|nr:hypothetical protein NQZ68_000757 [Dissostichus eleginoides]
MLGVATIAISQNTAVITATARQTKTLIHGNNQNTPVFLVMVVSGVWDYSPLVKDSGGWGKAETEHEYKQTENHLAGMLFEKKSMLIQTTVGEGCGGQRHAVSLRFGTVEKREVTQGEGEWFEGRT